MTNPATQPSRQVRRAIRRGVAQQAGFTPVANKRVTAAIQRAALIYQMQGQTAAEAHDNAINLVAKNLPAARMVRNNRPKPSKSDRPAYRKVSPEFALAA